LIMRRLTWILIALMLASCQVLGGGGEPATNNDDGAVIQWDRNPSTVVFRAGVTGGAASEEFIARGEIPICTIYGDGRVVWTADGSYGDVLFDRLDDETIRRFIEYLVIQQQIYTYGAEADIQPFTDTEPVVEQLTLYVNGVTHITDAYGGWDFNYFLEIVDYCRSMRRTPTIFEPTGAWLTVIEVDYRGNLPFVGWDAQASGLDLAALAASGESRWITGRNVRALWAYLKRTSPDLQFGQGEGTYQIVLQIPNVTRDSPPAP
jgi:hypothetical protein